MRTLIEMTVVVGMLLGLGIYAPKLFVTQAQALTVITSNQGVN